MPKKSAGLLLYRQKPGLEFFLVHPGGPFYVKKDHGVWSIPKGEFGENEEPLTAAIREFKEETGILPKGTFVELRAVSLASGKKVYAWALEYDLDPKMILSNKFTLEWPPKSGQFKEFPEIDKGEWFSIKEARIKLNAAQIAFIDEILRILTR